MEVPGCGAGGGERSRGRAPASRRDSGVEVPTPGRPPPPPPPPPLFTLAGRRVPLLCWLEEGVPLGIPGGVWGGGPDRRGPGGAGVRSRENVNFTPGPGAGPGSGRAARRPRARPQRPVHLLCAGRHRAARRRPARPRPAPARVAANSFAEAKKKEKEKKNNQPPPPEPQQPASGCGAAGAPRPARPRPPGRGTSHVAPTPERLPLPSFASAPPASPADGLRLSHPGEASLEPGSWAVGVGRRTRAGPREVGAARGCRGPAWVASPGRVCAGRLPRHAARSALLLPLPAPFPLRPPGSP
ncbi:uncharacterized protein RHO17_015312 isoform 1-T1 [Thomomys bottae]